MGHHFASQREEFAYQRQINQERREELAQRMAVADKIVMVLVDRISSEILRPGPDAAERECYIVAQELREFVPTLKELVVRILEVEKREGHL